VPDPARLAAPYAQYRAEVREEWIDSEVPIATGEYQPRPISTRPATMKPTPAS
jgi:hypothetical protein